MKPGDYVRVWLDDRKLGCGERGLIVLSVGRKWVRLFYPPSCDVVTVPVGQRQRVRPGKLRKGAMLRIIRGAAEFAGRTKAVDEAIALVKAA